MLRKIILGTSLVIFTTTGFAFAEIQSPIYTDDIGRSHFLGKGGYSAVRQNQMNAVQSDFVNDAVNNFSQKESQIKETVEETDITKVIQEKPTIPVSSKNKATFTTEQRKMDATAPYGYGMTNIPAGVNESKTLYTDELGRLHFFGKDNKFKE